MRTTEKHNVADVKRLTREHILLVGTDSLAEIRRVIGHKLYPNDYWPESLDQQVYRVLQIMVNAGELVREGRGNTRYNAIRYYTPERHQQYIAQVAAAKQAAAETTAAWEVIRDTLRDLGLDARLNERGNRIDMDLDTWQELLSRLS